MRAYLPSIYWSITEAREECKPASQDPAQSGSERTAFIFKTDCSGGWSSQVALWRRETVTTLSVPALCLHRHFYSCTANWARKRDVAENDLCRVYFNPGRFLGSVRGVATHAVWGGESEVGMGGWGLAGGCCLNNWRMSAAGCLSCCLRRWYHLAADCSRLPKPGYLPLLPAAALALAHVWPQHKAHQDAQWLC